MGASQIVYIRTDGNADIAAGHIMRCLTIAEKIINAKFGIKDSLDQNLFTLDIIYKFSNYNIMNDEERIEIIWYILLYIATYYNTLNFYK